MIFLLILSICILNRVGGWGIGERFLPFLSRLTWGNNGWFIFNRYVSLAYVIGAFYHDIITTISFALVLSIFNYGESGPIRKWIGRDGQFLLYGFMFGLASWHILGLNVVYQAIISSLWFYLLMRWSQDGIQDPYVGGIQYKLDHAYTEFLFPIGGLLLHFFK